MTSESVTREHFEVALSTIGLPSIQCLSPETSLGEVSSFLQKGKFGACPVSENNKLLGIVTERDLLLRVVGKIENWKESKLHEVMMKKPVTLSPDVLVADCMRLMSRRNFRHIPIVDEQGIPVSMLSVKDILRFMVKLFPNEVEAFGTKTSWSMSEQEVRAEDFTFEDGRGSENWRHVFLSPLKKILVRDPLSVDVEMNIAELLQLMQERHQGTALVTKFGTSLVGIVTERDFIFKVFNQIEAGILDQTVASIMTPSPHTLLPRHPLYYAINNMFSFGYRNVVLVDEDRIPVGVISPIEVFQYLCDIFEIQK
jgi:CBS domain-containing protein